MSFGYLSSVLGETILPIPSLDKCNISLIIKKQSHNTDFGPEVLIYTMGILIIIKKHLKLNWVKNRKWFFLFKVFLRNFLWAWRGTLWVIITIVSIILNNIPLIGNYQQILTFIIAIG